MTSGQGPGPWWCSKLLARAPGGQCSDLTAAWFPQERTAHGHRVAKVSARERDSGIWGTPWLLCLLPPSPPARAPPCPCLHPGRAVEACMPSHRAARGPHLEADMMSEGLTSFPSPPKKPSFGASGPGSEVGAHEACGGTSQMASKQDKGPGQGGLLEHRPMPWKVTSPVPSQGCTRTAGLVPIWGVRGGRLLSMGCFPPSSHPPWGHSATPKQEEEA